MPTFTSTLPTASMVAAPASKGPGLRLQGTNADETFYGSANADEIHGGGGRDVLYGGNGNDTLDGGAGADVLIGGLGFDTVTYATATAGVTFDTVAGGLTNDAQGDSYSGIERFIGTRFADIMSGSGANEEFQGGGGNDMLFGQSGNDVLDGGAGDDTIRGGEGHDVLTGGLGFDVLSGGPEVLGADTFVFTPNSGADVITDFMTDIDKIRLVGFGDKPFGNDGILAIGEFGYEISPGVTRNTHFSHLDVSDQFFYDYHTHKLYAIDPLLINGDLQNLREELVATINYHESATVQIGTNDFFL